MSAKICSYGFASDGSGEVYVFHCPGCGYDHPFHVGGDRAKHPQWSFNGSVDRPTFSPSLVVNKGRPNCCHSFVTDGKIKFLDDSFHGLKGTTVDLPDWECDEEALRLEALKRNIKRP